MVNNSPLEFIDDDEWAEITPKEAKCTLFLGFFYLFLSLQ